jgi:hypothetical protein
VRVGKSELALSVGAEHFVQTTGVGPGVSKGPGIAAREDGGFLPKLSGQRRFVLHDARAAEPKPFRDLR